MIPAAFDYTRATSVEDAIRLLKEVPGSMALAGGHSLLPLMKLRLSQPERVVDLGPLREELGFIRSEDRCVRIGAMTRHHDLATSEVLKARCPGLADVAGVVGDPQVRHCGTVGGSVAHGDAAADLPTALLALDAEFEVATDAGLRIIRARDFFLGFLTTALEPGELLVGIKIPARAPGARATYTKFNRRAQDWATVGVFAIADVDNGVVNHAAVGLTNMGSTPLRASAVEAALQGKSPTAEALAAAAALADEGTDPTSDKNASASFRRHLARVLTHRSLRAILIDSKERP
jgi:aerobic carbon-monoxide dehydrogenase medium subunit